MVHLLNGHLIARKMTPIAFLPTTAEDEVVRHSERKDNNKTIWVNGEKVMIESRAEVVEEYKNYAKEVHNVTLMAAVDEGMKSTAGTVVTETGEGPNKKVRRRLNLNP